MAIASEKNATRADIVIVDVPQTELSSRRRQGRPPIKARLLLPLALAFLSIADVDALACVCLYSSPCEEFGRAKLIFTGRMIEGSEKLGKDKDKDGQEVSYEAGQVRFSVDEVFKGDKVSEITLSVASNKNTSCGYSMIRGERYLVYAYEHNGKLGTGICTRTTLVSNEGVKEDFDFLRNLPAPGGGGTLAGRIWSAEGGAGAKSMEGVTVVVTGEDKQRFETVTDKEGGFKLAGLKPGKYKVEPIWPAYYIDYYPNEAVEVFDRSCVETGFEAKIDGRISGRIFDANGRPASVTIYLEPVEPETVFDRELGISDEEGNFEIHGIRPGHYVLYFKLRTSDGKDEKKYFYPGTWERKEATVIDLPVGQRISGYNFQTPPEFIVQTVEGRATWADGSPAAGVGVWFLCPRSGRPGGQVLEFGAVETKTDEEGRFKLQGFKGNIYWLEARGRKRDARGEGAIGNHSQTRRIILRKDLTGVNVSLSLPGFSGNSCK
jgi:hypothetical protein